MVQIIRFLYEKQSEIICEAIEHKSTIIERSGQCHWHDKLDYCCKRGAYKPNWHSSCGQNHRHHLFGKNSVKVFPRPQQTTDVDGLSIDAELKTISTVQLQFTGATANALLSIVY